MTYSQAIKYLESFIDYEITPSWHYQECIKLERVRGFLQGLGNPQDSLNCIHVAGSKGKGSTCAFISYILKAAGYRVGLYTSPHLSDFRERIRVLSPMTENRKPKTDFEGMIPRRALAQITSRIKPGIESYNRISRYGPLTFFEVYTAIAFLYFKEKRVDFAVLETGLGGRLDATNVVDPLVCAIAPISLEHTDKLGKTLRKIAAEKAGIIKEARPVVCAPQEREVQEVIRARCRDIGAELRAAGNIPAKFRKIRLRLLGAHQKINAAVAIEAVGALKDYGFAIGDADIAGGLRNTVWPGRCEVISRRPRVILDGAQNAASAKVLRDAVKDNFKYRNLTLVLGVSSDKDIRGICRQLSALADKVILTRSGNPRALDPVRLCSNFRRKERYVTKNVGEAKSLAQRLSGAGDLILVTGSLFVVGEYRNG